MVCKRLLAMLIVSPVLMGAASSPNVCPYAMTAPNDRTALLKRLSANAELVAPTESPVAKRRAVAPRSAALPIANFIDGYVAASLAKAGVAATVASGDEEFLRRVSIDLTGEIPDAATVKAFVADGTPGKRATKIDDLLKSDGFTERWTMWFGDLVQNVQSSSTISYYYIGRNAYYDWIRESISSGKPYDQMVRELITASGSDSFVRGETNYIVRQLQATAPRQDTFDNLATSSAEKFLGIPLICVSCHSGAGHLERVNTYLKGRTRHEFWRTAAFFARTDITWSRFQDNANPSAYVVNFSVTDNLTGRYLLNTKDGNKSPRMPAPGEPDDVSPAFILTGEEPRTNETYREAFARMLTSDRQFARAAVNYLWREMFGLGLVEPANAFDLAKLDQQPSHPALLEALTDQFIASGYSIRSLLRTIAMSNTYQLSTRYTAGPWNEAWVPLYARHYPRRLMAETVLDAVTKATGISEAIPVLGMPPRARALQIPDPLEPGPETPIGRFLNTFGRGDRDESTRSNESSTLQALAMMNDSVVTRRVSRSTSGSLVGRVLDSTTDPGSIIDEIYVSTLCRKPTAIEKEIALDGLRQGVLADRVEDLQFVLLNSLEFIFN